jgi:hypothetical protein
MGISRELKPLTPERLKGSTPTLGMLILVAVVLCGAVTFGASFTRKSDTEIKRVVKETLQQHSDQRVTRAHPDADKVFMPRDEVRTEMEKTKKEQLRLIHESQQEILRAIRVRRIR